MPLINPISQGLCSFWPDLECAWRGDVLYASAEGRLVSNLSLSQLAGGGPEETEAVLYHAAVTVPDDLLRDWSRWETPALVAKLDARKLATAGVWQGDGH